jgi:LysM repeat protein
MAGTRRHLARFGAPAAFLLGITIAALLVRAGLESGGAPARTGTVGPARQVTTATAATRTRPATTHAATTAAAGEYVTVQSGDSLYAIATRAGTSVSAIEALNPGVDPAALHVGQRIRVK